ncbi:secondary thiamine-phosphate synthase enzyme YjbQ [Planctomycetota bacterium]
METITISTPSREVLVDITSEVKHAVKKSGIQDGICIVFIPHTTAGITINENADPSVKTDIIEFLKKLIPRSADFSHIEGNSDSHIKSSLVGDSETILVENGSPVLGTWQGVCLAEFDGPRKRKVHIKVIGP